MQESQSTWKGVLSGYHQILRLKIPVHGCETFAFELVWGMEIKSYGSNEILWLLIFKLHFINVNPKIRNGPCMQPYWRHEVKVFTSLLVNLWLVSHHIKEETQVGHHAGFGHTFNFKIRRWEIGHHAEWFFYRSLSYTMILSRHNNFLTKYKI